MLASYLQTFREFHRDVYLHFLAISVIGFTVDGGVFSAIFNLFLLRLGYEPDFIGQILSSGLLVFAICSLPAGAVGNWLGNRRAMIMGLVIMLVSNVGLVFVEFLPSSLQSGWLFATYSISFGGVALYFVNTAPFLMASVTEAQRSHAFSIQSAMISLAAFGGSLVGGLLPGVFARILSINLDSPVPYRYPLMIASATIIVGIIALMRVQENELRPIRSMPPWPKRSYSTQFRVPRLRQIDWRVIGASFVVLMVVISVIRVLQISGMAVVMTFFNVYMDDGLGASTSQVGLLSGLARLLSVPIVLSMPLMSARWSNQQLVIWSTVSAFFFMMPLALIAQPWAAGIGYMGVMAGSSIRYTAFMIFAMELVKPEQRSILSGVSEMTAGISFAVMAFLGGFLIVSQGYTFLFMLGAILTLVGTAIFWLYFGLRPKGKVGAQSTIP